MNEEKKQRKLEEKRIRDINNSLRQLSRSAQEELGVMAIQEQEHVFFCGNGIYKKIYTFRPAILRNKKNELIKALCRLFDNRMRLTMCVKNKNERLSAYMFLTVSYRAESYYEAQAIICDYEAKLKSEIAGILNISILECDLDSSLSYIYLNSTGEMKQMDAGQLFIKKGIHKLFNKCQESDDGKFVSGNRYGITLVGKNYPDEMKDMSQMFYEKEGTYQLWFNFTHSGIMTNYKFDLQECIRHNKNWIDVISPETISFYNDYFVMNGKQYGRVMYISKHAQSLESDTIAELAKINSTNYITINNELLDLSGYKQEITRKHSSVGLQIEREKKRNRDNHDFLADANDKLLSDKDSLIKLSRQVESGDDHFFNTTIMIMFLAKSMQELDEITEQIIAVGGVKSFEVKPCFHMQRQGINSTLMFGAQEFKRMANFSAPCLAMYMPFKTQELNDNNGTYYGINKLSQNPIIANRKLLDSYHGMILGKTRSGKSVFAKCEIISNRCLNPEDQILIIDPQNEYKGIAHAPGVNGSVVSFDSQKEIYVNPMDVNFEGVDYATLQEIIAEKTDFIITLLSSCMRRDIDSGEQGILDKVIDQVYSENYAMRKKLNGESGEVTEFSVPAYMQKDTTALPVITDMSAEEQERKYSPTLQDVYQKLKDMENDVTAQKLAAHMQIFVNGSLNLFNHKTNIDLNRKFLVFDISGIKENLRVTCMLVMLEIVKTKIKWNFARGNWTNVYIDEFHELLGVPAVADYVIKLWKEVGKLHGSMTGITQNMTDLINKSPNSDKLAAILSNTEYFAMLNQSTIDRRLLADFLPSISPAMFNFVEGASKGTGLLKMGPVTVPFDMRMSNECKLYQYVNTDGNNQDSAI